MIWALALMQALALWWLYEIRQALALRRRSIPWLGRSTHQVVPADFRGAVPPNRYVVVHWPSGQVVYQGCIGARAREVYEQTNPAAPGDVIEFWELGERRGVKEF